jgi:hypothetical protein
MNDRESKNRPSNREKGADEVTESFATGIETGQFIVLDLFNPEMVNVECDQEGKTLYFDSEEAFEHAEEVQKPLVIELPCGGTSVLRGTHVLLNVVLFPENAQSDDIPSGKENHIYLNGKYISRWCDDEYDDYTVTWEGYCDILNGLKMAIPGLTCRDILLDGVRLTQILGENWREYYEEGSLWARVGRQLGVQVIE